jgi:predicted transglutaminase-like cysteine proteinase
LIAPGLAALQPASCETRPPTRRERRHISSGEQGILKRGAAASIVALTLLGCPTASTAEERPLFISTGESTQAPSGWIGFCVEYDRECKTEPSSPRDAVLSDQALKDLERINRWVNTNIKPMSDMEHWSVLERWNYPDDGYGDCEDYVLLKRRMLMQAGWPREALLITVVLNAGDGHAVLTVKTDKGEFILDNETDDILLWSDTAYRFVERQSQADPNVWISLGDPRGAATTAAFDHTQHISNGSPPACLAAMIHFKTSSSVVIGDLADLKFERSRQAENNGQSGRVIISGP